VGSSPTGPTVTRDFAVVKFLMGDETPLNPQLSGAWTAMLAEARNVARGSVTAVRSPYRRVAIGTSWRVATGVRSRRGSLASELLYWCRRVPYRSPVGRVLFKPVTVTTSSGQALALRARSETRSQRGDNVALAVRAAGDQALHLLTSEHRALRIGGWSSPIPRCLKRLTIFLLKA